MDYPRGKHSYRGHRYSTSQSPRHHVTNNYNTSSNHGFLLTSRLQRHPLKWKKDCHRGNYRSRMPYRRNDSSCKKSNKSAEDAEEEERKKKLTDTAKKLLNKIKTWNAEKNCIEEDLQKCTNVNEISSENSCKSNEEKTIFDDKPKRIAHSKKAKLLKSRICKSFNQPSKTTGKYDVNKETVKNFQNRIQHKLIEEIMQMPKENLQNVLNDPKINPIMELKMSRLVKENKLLIAQKLRDIAESKMKSVGSSTNSQLLVDIDKLIDPVIETDLSVLPYELIKQMENVFQVQFDYSHNNADSQVETVDKIVMADEDITTELNNIELNVKVENNEDLSVYECSTDEDEENGGCNSTVPPKESPSSVVLEEILNKIQGVPDKRNIKSAFKKRKLSHIEVVENKSEDSTSPSNSNENAEESYPPKQLEMENNQPLIEKSILNQCTPPEPTENSCMSQQMPVDSQTQVSFESTATQTSFELIIPKSLYGIPLPKETINESYSSLLEEVNSIQALTNKLNERRLMIFLQLAQMNPSGDFILNDVTRKNFMETISNGNLPLVESLKQFFNSPRYNRSGHRSSEKCTNKSRQRNR